MVGIDVDETKIGLAPEEAAAAGVHNVEFRIRDVMEPFPDGDRFDGAYARFVLTHLPDPAEALGNLCAQLVPGGVLIVEDIDCSGHFCASRSAAFRRYVELCIKYIKTVESSRCDPNIGLRLPGLLGDAGLGGIGMTVVQPAGEVKLTAPLTLEAIADAVLAAGLATAEELGELVDDLYAFAEEDGTSSAFRASCRSGEPRPRRDHRMHGMAQRLGGGSGIRTHGGQDPHTLSKRADSAALASLLGWSPEQHTLSCPTPVTAGGGRVLCNCSP